MKTCTKNLFLAPVLITGFGLILAGRVTAQTFTTLYSFTATPLPHAGLISSGNTLYGTASGGGSRPSPLSLKRRTKIPLSQQGAKFVLQNETTATMAFPSGS